jgi:hypothetical protein
MQTRSGILKGGLVGGGLSLLGCLGILAVITLCVGGILFLVTGAFRSSDVYQEALAAAQNDPEVQAALGTPIEPGWFVMGSMETSGLSGTADLRIPIHGPDGSGTLFAGARRENGVWRFYTLAVEVDGQDNVIVLDN